MTDMTNMDLDLYKNKIQLEGYYADKVKQNYQIVFLEIISYTNEMTFLATSIIWKWEFNTIYYLRFQGLGNIVNATNIHSTRLKNNFLVQFDIFNHIKKVGKDY